MLTQRLTRPLAIGAAVVVIGGGAAGIVSATSGNGSADASAGTRQAGMRDQRRGRDPTRGLGRPQEV